MTGYRRIASRLRTWEPAAPLSTGPDGGRATNNAASASSTPGKKAPVRTQASPAAEGPKRRTAATTCGWCSGPIPPGSRGPIPKWCSATCRHRAWEQRRAATSGRTAVQVVERRVEIHVPLEPTRRDWSRLLSELAGQLDDGRVYDRDLPALGRALDPVLRSYRRRARWSGAPKLL